MKPPKRISPAILRTRLSMIKAAINAKNYGYAEEMIDSVMERMNRYDWKRLKEIEIDDHDRNKIEKG